jgi:glyoxylase I family protein
MARSISTGPVHHLMLTVSDLDRARDFYTRVLGFQVATEMPPRAILLSDGNTVLALGKAPEHAIPGDHFDENRVGLDHLSFSVGSRVDLEKAAAVLDEYGIYHGGIDDQGAGMKMYTLTFRDPDNIQLELTAPYESNR